MEIGNLRCWRAYQSHIINLKISECALSGNVINLDILAVAPKRRLHWGFNDLVSKWGGWIICFSLLTDGHSPRNLKGFVYLAPKLRIHSFFRLLQLWMRCFKGTYARCKTPVFILNGEFTYVFVSWYLNFKIFLLLGKRICHSIFTDFCKDSDCYNLHWFELLCEV